MPLTRCLRRLRLWSEGSGSRSFYFNDPDGNRLEIFTDGMKVPNGETIPRAEYAGALEDFMKTQRATA